MVLKKVCVSRWNIVIEQIFVFVVMNIQFSCEQVEQVMMCLMLFCIKLIVVVKNVVVVLMMMMKCLVLGVNLISGDMWQIRNMFVVIMVVVWISVEIGVGFFIVLGNQVCSRSCVDLFIVLMNSRKVSRFVVFQLVYRKCIEVCVICGICVKILLNWIELVSQQMLKIFSRKLKLLMWLMMNVFIVVVFVDCFLKQKLISRYEVMFMFFQLKNICSRLFVVISISMVKVKNDRQVKNWVL